jgi:hypothetical protein
MSETYNNYVTPFAKDFEVETNQIVFWFESLNDVKTHINILRESVETETKLYESLGRNMGALWRAYMNDSCPYRDEPSNMNELFLNLISLFDTIGKTFSEDILMLNVQVNKFVSTISNDIFSLKKSISESSNNLMSEIYETKKKSINIQSKYAKLKSELEEAHMNKKRLENDPKLVYNVTVKEKAEGKILDYIKEIEDLIPFLENCSQELNNKKESFNNNMKETFELVVSSVFKNNIKINQTLFLVSKEKSEIMLKLKNASITIGRKIQNINLHLNDYIERKWAEKKDLFYDSIDSIVISSDKNFDPTETQNLIKICDSLFNYSNNFYNCMKLRKRSLRIFSKFISDFSKTEEAAANNFSKLDKHIIMTLKNFIKMTKGTSLSLENMKTSFDSNQALHDTFQKFLVNNVFSLLNIFVKESKNDYKFFMQNWNKISKDMLNYKNLLIKFQGSREKIQNNIKELRNNYSQKKLDLSKFEAKLKNFNEEDNNLKNSFSESALKIKSYLSNTLQNLKKIVKSIREKEFQRIHKIVESLENITKYFEKIFDQNLENSKSLMNISAGIDIFEDIKETFDQYFTKFKINKYDGFIEKIIRKFLKKYESERNIQEENILGFGMEMNMFPTPYNGSPESKRKPNPNYELENLNLFNHNQSINEISQLNFNQQSNECSAVIMKKFNSVGSSENRKDNNTSYISPYLLKSNNDALNQAKKISFGEANNLMQNFTLERDYSAAINQNGSAIENIDNEREREINFQHKNSEKYQNYFNPETKETKEDNLYNVVNIQNDENFESPHLEMESYFNSNNIPNQINNKFAETGFSNQNFLMYNQTSHSQTSHEETINFVDHSKFNLIDAKNPYNNIKEQELKEYMEKLKRSNKNGASFINTPIQSNLNNAQNTPNVPNAPMSRSNEMVISDEIQSKLSNPFDENEDNIVMYENIFPLESDEKVEDNFYCAYYDKILLQGKLYITNKKLVFYTWFNNKTLFGPTKLIIPLVDIVRVEKKYNLKIFNNSIKIITKKSELFFTSFVYRDACYKMIQNYIEEIRKLEFNKIQSNKDDEEDLEDEILEKIDIEGNPNHPKIQRAKGIKNNVSATAFKSNFISKILKKLEFFSKLDKIHNQRLEEFETNKFNDIQPFKAESTFKKVYYKDEPVGNFPLPIAYLNLFHNENVCEELGRGKGFWESLYELRNDFDLTYERVTEGINSEIPKFFEDPEHALTLFSNIDEDSMTNFLEEIKNWPKMVKFYFKFIHPIKKKLIGPDKVTLREEFCVYFVSPKLFIVEITNYGFNFPYSDCFNTITQYRFNTNYKYSASEGIFKFNTTCTVMFQIVFVKSCFFKGMIEDEGYKESLENLKFKTYEKIKTVLDSEGQIFMELFEKLNEENLIKTKNNFYQLEGEVENNQKNSVEDGNNDENSSSDNESMEANEYDRKGWKIEKQGEFNFEQSCSILRIKKDYILPGVFLIVINFLLYFLFTKVNFNFQIDLSLEKIFNVLVIFSIGLLFYKLNNLKK